MDAERVGFIVIVSGRVGRQGEEPWQERRQHLDVPMTLTAERTPRGVDVGGAGRVGGCDRRGRAEELACTGNRGTALPIGEEAEVADAHEAARKHVD